MSVIDGQLALWPTGPLARATDPATSHDAPPSAEFRGDVHRRVLEAHRDAHGLSDEELCARLPDVTAGSVIKRRGELVRAGVLRDTGGRILNARDRWVIVWGVETGADE